MYSKEREYLVSSARVLAGLANSLLTGNVYMVECAPSNLVPSLKQIEVEILISRTFIFKSNLGLQAASRSMGAILIFVFYVIFKQFGFKAVAISGGVLPTLAFVGTLCCGESPIFKQR